MITKKEMHHLMFLKTSSPNKFYEKCKKTSKENLPVKFVLCHLPDRLRFLLFCFLLHVLAIHFPVSWPVPFLSFLPFLHLPLCLPLYLPLCLLVHLWLALLYLLLHFPSLFYQWMKIKTSTKWILTVICTELNIYHLSLYYITMYFIIIIKLILTSSMSHTHLQ